MTQATDTDIRDIKTSIDNFKSTVIKQSHLLGYILFGIAGLILGAYLRIAELLANH
jgi:hypothetical protein